jgi:tRNA threonylcarbamoyladenosine biosynthesis protein TsaB
MVILGIETATKTGGVAILSERGVLAAYTLNIEATHSERLMLTVDRVLSDTGRGLADIDGFAVSVGPGSFTGLRIGVSTVKGLAFATGKPVAAVPTLRALAGNLPWSRYPVCPLLDARKNEVYAAIYRSEAGMPVPVMAERTVALRELAGGIFEQTVFIGEGALLYREELRSLLGDLALFAPLSAMVPSAASVAELGRIMLREGMQVEPERLTPIYIRRPEAEIAWERRQRSR